ncbi:MAG: hypothetical protein M1827_000004 [Pycnora praestabilis]|nr:MAG: hypothetical protein M1827_000004 [Pycnora praestabilis]
MDLKAWCTANYEELPENCKFEHPQSNHTVQTQNRFAAFQSPSSNASTSPASSPFGGTGGNRPLPFQLSKEIILNDLSKEVPQWILSAYGPGRDAPIQLFGGHPREQSFEEMRLQHYIAATSGNTQQAIQEAQALVQNAQQQMQTALNDIDGALNYIINGAETHPNRHDICAGASTAGQAPAQSSNPLAQSSGAFSKPAETNGGAFGVPSFGQASGTFGQPTAIAPTAGSGFGQPSQLGGGFGQPSQLGQKPSPFGQPSQLNGGFGQPSQLGQRSSPFGQPSQSRSGFGQPSQLDHNPSLFGQQAQSSGASSFGQPTQLGTAPNPFAGTAVISPGFGNQSGRTEDYPKQPQSTSGGFGQPSQNSSTGGFGQTSLPATSSFGQPSQPASTNPFAQPSVPITNGIFGKPGAPSPIPFGVSPASSGPNLSSADSFGQSSQSSQQAPFGAPAPASFGTTSGSTSDSQSSYGTGGANLGNWPKDETNNPTPFPVHLLNPYAPDSALSHPDLRAYSIRDPQNRLLVWKGKPVSVVDGESCHRHDRDTTWEKIWFPTGPPAYNKDTEVGDEKYDDVIKGAYLFMREQGSFQGGVMPEVPPKREWCKWDF